MLLPKGMAMLSKDNKYFLALVTAFISLLVVSNIIAVKTITIGGLIVPAAVLCYSLTFVVTDTLSEIWGKKTTQFVITLGFAAAVLSAIFIKWAIEMKGSPFWENQEAFQTIMGSNIRVVIASLVAYLASQRHDVWAFHYWKSRTKGKHLWLRNNLSSMVSQLIDTTLFIMIAFYGTGVPILQMIFGQYLVKLAIAALDTPIVYGLVAFIRPKLNTENA